MPGACGAGGAGRDPPLCPTSLCSPLQSWPPAHSRIGFVPLKRNPARKEFRKALRPLGQGRHPPPSAPSASVLCGMRGAGAFAGHSPDSLTHCICFKMQPGAISSPRLSPKQRFAPDLHYSGSPGASGREGCGTGPGGAHQEGASPACSNPSPTQPLGWGRESES